ncbi:asparaginase [Acidimicrobiaceae bacterium AH-315-P05]|nr:asparaginase [Acidimicrobiaceae bacterium AH-315-P05]
MTNAALTVEVTRGNRVESKHRVDAVVSDAKGVVVASWGDADRPTQPRSASKPLQAIPLITSGAADDAGLTEVELALACASHNGEEGHVAAVEAWLGAVGASVADLECGSHAPSYRPAADAMVSNGISPTAAHNNCSGKHSGFIHTLLHLGDEIAGYLSPSHPQQVRVTRSLTRFAGIDVATQAPGIDGCGIPVWTMPLQALAKGWAQLQDPQSVDADEAAAANRLLDAMVHQPWFVAGTEGRSTTIMHARGGRVVAKGGAEGVFCAVDRETGRGFALKTADGASRASEVAIEWLVARMLRLDEPAPEVLRNHAGTAVGEIRVRAS